MPKSPLSTPCTSGNQGFRGRGRARGYNHNQMRSNNGNYHHFSSPNHTPVKEFAGQDMIPLESSSPIFPNHNRGWRQPQNRHNHRFSTTEVSSSFDQRNSFQSNPSSPYTPQRFQRDQRSRNNGQKHDPVWHRKVPISEYFDRQSMFENPWAELEVELEEMRRQKDSTIVQNNTSVEIILERKGLPNSSLESGSDDTTVNISSSCDEIRSQENSSIELPLDSMNFTRDSIDGSLLSDKSSQSGTKSKDIHDSQNDSVVIIS
ncbi:hypothetical protein QAD02_022226 [Eretmocerus hayati]|uniref:Uncharacterized protein n=1 Tax=Eretmocerus hayati TaxID=131215 RepID=A0ACC2PSP7_9HYME|nr:hypothetical protein QAD02_022226 [Eretmocerus hayati]